MRQKKCCERRPWQLASKFDLQPARLAKQGLIKSGQLKGCIQTRNAFDILLIIFLAVILDILLIF